MTLRDTVLSFDDNRRTPVEVPEWGGLKFYARKMTAKRQAAYSLASTQHPDAPNGVLVIVFGIEDDAGNLVFTPDDIPALSEKDVDAINRLALAVTSQHKSVEELRKN